MQTYVHKLPRRAFYSLIRYFSQVFLSVSLSVFCRRHTLCFAEHSAEVHRIIVSDHRSDVGDGIVRRLKQRLRVADPDIQDVLHR